MVFFFFFFFLVPRFWLRSQDQGEERVAEGPLAPSSKLEVAEGSSKVLMLLSRWQVVDLLLEQVDLDKKKVFREQKSNFHAAIAMVRPPTLTCPTYS